jgi:hemolysin activation/secretion protein
VESRFAEVGAGSVMAQAKPEAEPAAEEVRPEAEEAEPAAEEAAPEAADQEVLIKKIVFTGNTVIDTAALAAATESFLGQELTLEDMNSVADMVTLTYQEAGYILARGYVPEQEIKDGVLKIGVSEGRIGKVAVAGNKWYHERVIKRYFQEQVRHGVIRENLLEKALLMTNDIQDSETRIVLKRGEEPGTADMVLNTKDQFPIDFSIDYNNYGSDLTAEEKWGARLNFTEPGWGNEFSVRGITGNDPSDQKLLTLDWAIPVNSYGTKVALNYLHANYIVGQDLADLGVAGESRRYGVGVYHPLIRTGTMNLTARANYERKYAWSFIQEDILSTRAKQNVYSLGFDFDLLDRYLGKTFVAFTYGHGRLRDRADVPHSAGGTGREDADRYFDKLNLDVVRVQKIYGYTNVMLRGSGQWCADRLTATEQFAIGGYGAVRGHDPAVFIGDSGYILSAELMFAPPGIADKVYFDQRIAQMVQLALFVDTGGVYTANTKSSEYGNEFITGYGLGLRLYYKDRFRFKFDMAIPAPDEQDITKDKWYYFMFDFKLI